MADDVAGTYELVDLRWDEVTSGPQDRVVTFNRHVRGDELELNEEDARRMLATGSVVKAGEREKAEADQAVARLRAVLAQVPDEVRAALARDLTPEDLASREVPTEELTVATARGLTPEGSPRGAAATMGEGDGGPDPQDPGEVDQDAGVGERPGDSRRVDALDAGGVVDKAVSSSDDGPKTTRSARRA